MSAKTKQRDEWHRRDVPLALRGFNMVASGSTASVAIVIGCFFAKSPSVKPGRKYTLGHKTVSRLNWDFWKYNTLWMNCSLHCNTISPEFHTLFRALRAHLVNCYLCVPKRGYWGPAVSLAHAAGTLHTTLKTCTSAHVKFMPPKLEG